ncbi:opticin isoform X2 [Ochotona curzoniae]|uniref:opticin isoform X2 n=1 Tax=Ochotona curzoniae TaxID=130825 RepID=UPI001B34C8E0|nr:opticin isoform X2 [Ochotona curzoniae]
MRLPAFLSLLVLALQEAEAASLPMERKQRGAETAAQGGLPAMLPLGDYNYSEILDLGNYEELTDYGDHQPPEVSPAQSTKAPRILSASPTTPRPDTTSFPTSPEPGLPTCLVCVCLGSSVYCDDADLESIPRLPRSTAYLYARFNRISHVRAQDFEGLTKLKRIDLSGNAISSIEHDALSGLPALQDLLLPDNQLAALPMLPGGIEVLDVRLNRLQSSGIQLGAFKALGKLQFLYLADNLLDSIPGPLPLSLCALHLQNNMITAVQADAFCAAAGEQGHARRLLEDIRLDGNPVNLSLFPDAYFCLPRLPTGRFA